MQADSSGSIDGTCICCLLEGKHQHGGAYIRMFKKCLNLIMVPDPQSAFLMCAACIGFVNEVHRFREMVLSSQRQLNAADIKEKDTTFIAVPSEVVTQNNIATIQQVKIKVEVGEETLDTTFLWPENDIVDNLSDDLTDVKDENEEVISKNNVKLEDIDFDVKLDNAKGKRKRSLKKVKNQPKRKRKKYDSESDTPISQIKENKHKIKNKEVKKEPKPTLSENDLTKLRTIVKENNKIRANIILLLKNSTIIPFRNNFKSPFKCFYCDKGYIPFKELRDHTEREHINICEVRVRKVLRKLPEYLVTADVSCLKCKLCDEELKTIENLVDHLTKTHEKIFNETDKKPSHGIIGFDLSKDLKCHVCEKQFPFFKNLLVHMNEHGSFVCYICGKKFFSERKYRSHVTKHEKTGATPCKQCGKVFVSKNAMAFHNRKEHIKSTIKCLKCPETFHFERYSQRLEHMEKVHGMKRPTFKCETCGKEFKSSGILSTHINLIHKRNKEYRCDICSYATFNSSHFKNHVNTHIGIRNHECQICKKKFLKMYSLTRHMMVHLNDKRFKCPLCDATFIQKVNMKSHVRHRHKDFDVSKL